MLIIDGFFRARFGQDYPLSCTASIAFEQSYGEIDGDSASVAEIVALVSSLAELPVRQEIAITGSADQYGNVQPIGGVNVKVEGFYDVCRMRELSGAQGVIVPRQNVSDLQLRPDVVEAVRAGRFHVYAIDTVDEAVELLLGVEIGACSDDGLYAEQTVYGRVQDKLQYYADRMREYGKGPEGPGGEGTPADGAHAQPTEPTPPGEETRGRRFRRPRQG